MSYRKLSIPLHTSYYQWQEETCTGIPRCRSLHFLLLNFKRLPSALSLPCHSPVECQHNCRVHRLLLLVLYCLQIHCRNILHHHLNHGEVKWFCSQYRHDFPIIPPCWLLSATFLSFTCLEMVFRISHSVTFPGTEARLTSLQFLLSFFLPFLKIGLTFAFFHKSLLPDRVFQIRATVTSH